MRYFNNEEVFEEEMEKIKSIMEEKGYIVESDHPYAYAMQYGTAYEDVMEWLERQGYTGKLSTVGLSEGVAVYALYDELRISGDCIKSKLIMEAKKQRR